MIPQSNTLKNQDVRLVFDKVAHSSTRFMTRFERLVCLGYNQKLPARGVGVGVGGL